MNGALRALWFASQTRIVCVIHLHLDFFAQKASW